MAGIGANHFRMKTIYQKILFLVILFCCGSLTARADWQITGDAVPQGTQAVLQPNPDNSQEFIFVGKLTDSQFKITDGAKTYVHNCGDSDPLDQPVVLREQVSTDETGLRIRYVGKYDYFKVTLTVTSTEYAITATRIMPPKHVYIMGGPFNHNAANWLLDGAVELDQDAENPFVFYYRGDIRYNPVGSEGGNMKILVGRSWSTNYHPDASGNVPLSEASKMRLGGDDNKWSIPSDRSGDGHYVIRVDMLNLTIQVEEFIHNVDETPLAIFIVGDAMLCGWSNTTPMMMQKTQSGIYQWEGTTLQGQFKFLQRKGTWSRCYVATSSNEQIVPGNQNNLVYEENYLNGNGNDYKFVLPDAGEYHFTVDLNTMKLLVRDLATHVENPKADNGILFFSEEGKLFLKSHDEQRLQADVFGFDGREIAHRTFVRNTEIPLPQGCYFVLVRNGSGAKIAGIRTLVF